MSQNKKSKIKMSMTRIICLVVVILMLLGGTVATALAILLGA